MEEKKFPRVGIGIFVLKDGKFLLCKRKNSHGAGHWQLPGGHLEFNEKLEDCARREVIEETGVKIKNIRSSTITNDIFKKVILSTFLCFFEYLFNIFFCIFHMFFLHSQLIF